MVDELKRHLSSFYKQNSHLNDTRSQAMIKEKIGDVSYVLLTPLGEPNCQPIELLWGRVKNEVADRYVSKRTISETRPQVLEGFYGRGCGDTEIKWIS